MTSYQGVPPQAPPDPTAMTEDLQGTVDEAQLVTVGRSLERTIRALDRSARALHTAADAVDSRSPQTAHWIGRIGDRRRYQRHRIEQQTERTQMVGLRDRIDPAGWLRRSWIRFRARRGTAAVLGECERGEVGLLDAVESALEEAAVTDVPQPIHSDLVGLRENVASTIAALEGRRADFEHASA